MEQKGTLSKELLEILACPQCKGELIYDPQRDILICQHCQVFFEIIDGIPNLIFEEAKPLKDLNENQ